MVNYKIFMVKDGTTNITALQRLCCHYETIEEDSSEFDGGVVRFHSFQFVAVDMSFTPATCAWGVGLWCRQTHMRRVKDGTLPVVSIVLPNILKIIVIVLPNTNWGMIPYHYKWWWFPSIWSIYYSSYHNDCTTQYWGMIKYTMVDESWIVSEIILPNIHWGWFNTVWNPHGMTEGIWTLLIYIKFMITCIKVILSPWYPLFGS